MAAIIISVFIFQFVEQVGYRFKTVMYSLRCGSEEQIENFAFMAPYIYTMAVGPAYFFDHLSGQAVISLVERKVERERLERFFYQFFQNNVISGQSEVHPALCFQVVQIAALGTEFNAGGGIHYFACYVNFGQKPDFVGILGFNGEQQFVVFTAAERARDGIQLEFQCQQFRFGVNGYSAFLDECTYSAFPSDVENFRGQAI